MSNVQMPVPVIRSGERFAAKLTPHGPENAVLVGAMATPQVSDFSCAGDVIGICCGWPESGRLMSGPGLPSGWMIHGVWQSWQPPMVTRYLPRWTCSVREKRAVCGAATGREALAATITASDATSVAPARVMVSLRVIRFIVSSVALSASKVGSGDYPRFTGAITGRGCWICNRQLRVAGCELPGLHRLDGR